MNRENKNIKRSERGAKQTIKEAVKDLISNEVKNLRKERKIKWVQEDIWTTDGTKRTWKK